MSYVEQIQRRVYARTLLYSPWLPTERISVGDYGFLSQGRFNREANVRYKGIKLGIATEASIPSKLAFSDRATFAAKAGAGGKTAGKVLDAAMQITLHDEGAFVYQLQDIVSRRVKDKESFFRDLFLAILSGKLRWRDEFLIVDEVRQAGSATLIVLESDKGKLLVKGKGRLDAVEDAPLARLDADLSISVEEGSVFNAVCDQDATPLYNPRRLTFNPPGGSGGAGAALAAVRDWVLKCVGRPIIKPDDVRMVDYVAGEELFTFAVAGAAQTFQAQAAAVDIEEFLSLGGGAEHKERPLDDVDTEPVHQEDYVSGGKTMTA
jgi:hypothetical protein